MSADEIKFVEDNIVNFEAVALGFSKHIDFNILDEYTRIYQRNLDAQFVLNAWCGSCVFDMLKRLSALYESVKPIEIQTNQTNEQSTTNTRKRRKA